MKRKILTTLLTGAFALLILAQSTLAEVGIAYAGNHSLDGKKVNLIISAPDTGITLYRKVNDNVSGPSVPFNIVANLNPNVWQIEVDLELSAGSVSNTFYFVHGGGQECTPYCDYTCMNSCHWEWTTESNKVWVCNPCWEGNSGACAEYCTPIPSETSGPVTVIVPPLEPQILSCSIDGGWTDLIVAYHGRGEEAVIEVSSSASGPWTPIQTSISPVCSAMGYSHALGTMDLNTLSAPFFVQLKVVNDNVARYTDVIDVLPLVPASELDLNYVYHDLTQEYFLLDVKLPSNWEYGRARLERLDNPSGQWQTMQHLEIIGNGWPAGYKRVRCWLNGYYHNSNTFRLVNANGDVGDSIEVVAPSFFNWACGFSLTGPGEVMFSVRAMGDERWVEFAPTPTGPWTRVDPWLDARITDPMGSAVVASYIPNNATIPYYARMVVHHSQAGTSYSEDVYTVFEQPTYIDTELTHAVLNLASNQIILHGAFNCSEGSIYSSTDLSNWNYEINIGASPDGPADHDGVYEVTLDTTVPVKYYKIIGYQPIPEAGGRYYRQESQILGVQTQPIFDSFIVQ